MRKTKKSKKLDDKTEKGFFFSKKTWKKDNF